MGYQSNRNYQSNRPPMMEDPDRPPPQGAFPVWSKVFTQPSVRTFVQITEHPEAQAKAAYIWVFIVGTLSTLITRLAQSVVLKQAAPILERLMPGYTSLTQLPGGVPGLFGASLGLIGTVCSSAVSGIFMVAMFAIGVALVQAVAGAFGGRGSFDKLAYAFGAITACTSLLTAFLTLLSAIPYAVLCTMPLLLILVLYGVILRITAIKAVHRFGWGQAIIAFLTPGVLIFLLCGILLLVVRMALPSIVPQGIP